MKDLLRLLPLVRPYRAAILAAFLLLMLQTGLTMVIPDIIRQVIDTGLGEQNRDFLGVASLALLGVGVLRAVAPFGVRYLAEWVASHVGYDLRNQMYQHIQHLPFGYHDNAQAGQLISRTIEDVRAIERFTGMGIIEWARILLLMVSILAILLLRSVPLALLGLLPMVPMLLLTTNFGRRVGSYFLAVDQGLGEVSTRLQENVSGVQVVRAFAREEYENERFRTANQALYKARVKVMTEFGKMMPSTMLLVTAGTLLLLWFGGAMVLRGELTVGELVAFNSYLLLLMAPLQQVAWLVNSAGEAEAGIQRTFEVLDMVPAIRSPRDALPLPTLRGRVSFEDVCFSYASGKAAALEGIQLDVTPNQIVALIGPTGSGKTSLVNLIPRFYDVSTGAVRVDGIDVRDVDLVSLRRQIGIVLQTSLLFSATIRENIAYGRPEADMEEVIAAAKAAQAHDFITEMPEGYDTVVGERGVTLSGGQRQRVAIARALLMNPRILILDDSTSSVDTQTERLIQKALNTLMQGRTTFVIAHRLSTVHRADLIVVLDNGRIVERGTHTQLLAQGGLYRQIYELQLRDQEQFRERAELLETQTEISMARPAGSRSLE
jgi:ATP-binding cassette subfamily B protein